MPDPAEPPPEEVLRELLQQEEIRAMINRELAGKDLPYSVGELPYELQLQLVRALITDGAVSIGPGRVLAPEEFFAICEAEEQAESETKNSPS